MTEEERAVQATFENGVKCIQVLEVLSNNQQDSFKIHTDRRDMLQFMMNRLSLLRDMELNALVSSPVPVEEPTEVPPAQQ